MSFLQPENGARYSSGVERLSGDHQLFSALAEAQGARLIEAGTVYVWGDCDCMKIALVGAFPAPGACEFPITAFKVGRNGKVSEYLYGVVSYHDEGPVFRHYEPSAGSPSLSIHDLISSAQISRIGEGRL